MILQGAVIPGWTTALGSIVLHNALVTLFSPIRDDLEICFNSASNTFMNRRLMVNASALSNIHDINELQTKCNALGQPIYYMMAKIFNNHPVTTGDRDAWWSILNEMSMCNGAYMYTEHTNPGTVLSGHGGSYWSYPNRWTKNETSFHTFDVGERYVQVGNYAGLDYMLMYNLFHIQFSDELNLPQYSDEVICPCKSSQFPEISNSLNNSNWEEHTDIILPEDNLSVLTTTRVAEKYLFDYSNIGINLEKYIIKDATIRAGGLLYLKEDVKTCNNAEVLLSKVPDGAGGELKVGDGVSKHSTLRFVSGTQLHIEEGGLLNIQDSSRVIIEEGAILQISPGAAINLNGTNAVLEIQGKLEIMPNATFQTTGDGYVLFNIQNPDPSIAPYNVEASATSRMVFESSVSGHPYKLSVAAGTILYPQEDMEEFRADNVGIKLGDGAHIFLSSIPFHLQENYVYGPLSDGFIFSDLISTPVISNNTFFGCDRTLSFIGRDRGGRDVKIRYNTFDNCKTAIIIQEASSHIAGNNFINSGGIKAGTVSSTLIPLRAGGYLGALRVELNKFQNSNALEVRGAFYPHIDYCGNASLYTGSGFQPGFGFASEKAHSTLKCNYFEKQTEAVNLSTVGSINLSTLQTSFRAVGSGIFPTGGNNIFSNNSSSINVVAAGAFEGVSFPYARIQDGENSFISPPANSRSSFVLKRQQNTSNFASMFELDGNGDWEINGNYWSPTLGTFNYGAGNFPSNVIEKNYSLSNHFEIREASGFSPNFIVGTNTTIAATCPFPVWDEALADPVNFDPANVSGTGFNFLSPESEKVYLDRPFGLDGQGFSAPNTTVDDGVFNGQTFYNAYNNGLGGMTESGSDEHSNTVTIPKASGLLDMSDLLINTVSHTTSEEVSIYGFGYQAYLQCLSRAVALNIFESDPTGVSTQVSAALAVFTAMEENNLQYELSDPNRFYRTKFSIGVDKCHLYRLVDQYTDAQTVLSGLSSIASDEDTKTVDYLSCQVENERRLFDDEISWLEYYNNVTACGTLYSRSEFLPQVDSTGGGDSTQTGDGSSAPALTYVMSPNPATSEIDVTIDMDMDAVVTVAVYNKFGVQVTPTQNLGTLLTETQTVATVNLDALAADTYNMVVYADGVPYVQHFLVLTH